MQVCPSLGSFNPSCQGDGRRKSVQEHLEACLMCLQQKRSRSNSNSTTFSASFDSNYHHQSPFCDLSQKRIFKFSISHKFISNRGTPSLKNSMFPWGLWYRTLPNSSTVMLIMALVNELIRRRFTVEESSISNLPLYDIRVHICLNAYGPTIPSFRFDKRHLWLCNPIPCITRQLCTYDW